MTFLGITSPPQKVLRRILAQMKVDKTLIILIPNLSLYQFILGSTLFRPDYLLNREGHRNRVEKKFNLAKKKIFVKCYKY